jgi:hypothetical protein
VLIDSDLLQCQWLGEAVVKKRSEIAGVISGVGFIITPLIMIITSIGIDYFKVPSTLFATFISESNLLSSNAGYNMDCSR